MAFEFTETMTLEIPNVASQIAEFSESSNDTKNLIVEVAAIHEGMTANGNYYGAEALEQALETWVQPYPKPIIMNHDMESEAIGRVMAAKMDAEEDGTPFTRLQVAITDPVATQKVLDQRYLTGSVGGKAEEALCSVCNTDWAKASAYKLPCKHVRGRKYEVDGREHIAHIKMNKVSFREYSIVNAPADSRSSFRPNAPVAPQEGNESDGWIRARVFSLNMDKEEIVEYTESENHNILEGMKKKDSTPLYLGLKGAFLSALAVHESEESNVEDEDILSVSEELSASLATVSEDEDADDPKEPRKHKRHTYIPDPDVGGAFCSVCGAPASDPVHFDADGDGDDDGDDDAASTSTGGSTGASTGGATGGGTAAASDTDTLTAENDNDTNEEFPSYNRGPVNRPQGQEKVLRHDVDSETSAGAPLSREAEQVQVLERSNMELNEKIETLESRIEELEFRAQNVSEENAKLKTALKRSLVERVVDTKISLGMVSRENREVEMEEHLDRTAASLADSLRDLATAAPMVQDYSKVPTVESHSVAIPTGKDKNGAREKVTTVDLTESEPSKPDPIEFFNDILMGRKHA